MARTLGATPRQVWLQSNVQLTLPAEQTMSVLGRSGSGKTTLLKVIAGLEAADTGRVLLNGAELSGVPPEQRGIVYLYQEPLLFPHLCVFDNVAFGLKVRQVNRTEVQTRTTALLTELGLAEHAGKMPQQLSGGQRQRAAFGRALIVQPRLLLGFAGSTPPLASCRSYCRRSRDHAMIRAAVISNGLPYIRSCYPATAAVEYRLMYIHELDWESLVDWRHG